MTDSFSYILVLSPRTQLIVALEILCIIRSDEQCLESMDVSFDAYCREINSHQTYESWLQAKVQEAEQRHHRQLEIDELHRENQRLQICLATHASIVDWFSNWLEGWSKKASRSPADVYGAWNQARSQAEGVKGSEDCLQEKAS
jgi:hypothetical protein